MVGMIDKAIRTTVNNAAFGEPIFFIRFTFVAKVLSNHFIRSIH